MGFSTYSGHVTALPERGSELPLKHVLKPALPSSAEALLHANYAAHPGPKVLNLGRPCDDDARIVDALRAPRPQRFVGVNYISDDERRRHYIDADCPTNTTASSTSTRRRRSSRSTTRLSGIIRVRRKPFCNRLFVSP